MVAVSAPRGGWRVTRHLAALGASNRARFDGWTLLPDAARCTGQSGTVVRLVENSRRVQWLKFAGFVAVAVAALAACFEMAEGPTPYRPEPAATADHLLSITTTQGLDAIQRSTCLSVHEAGEVIQFTPDLFFVTVVGGRSRAQSVATCLRAELAAHVTLGAL